MSATTNCKPGANTLRKGMDDKAVLDPRRTFRDSLPIHAHRRELLYLVQTHPVTIVVGQTGSGKSTQMPQYLLEAGWSSSKQSIVVCQPRRIAAISLAKRVSEEVGCGLGTVVGYTVRFDDQTTSGITRVRFMTDGMLMREILYDPLLTRCSVVILDEAHERTIATELLAGLLKKIMRRRPELRVIVSSATIDAEAFRGFFGGEQAAIVSLHGRSFPVAVHYLPEACHDYVQAAIDTVARIHHELPAGDILVFMTGLDEINRVIAGLCNAKGLECLPLHAAMNLSEQLAVFERRTCRRAIVATNIAEASVTIDNIGYVVDCGRVKLRLHDTKTDMDVLAVTSCSKASATQRAGRAGRLFAGHAFRLYTRAEHEAMPDATIPDLHRTDLSSVLVQLKALGIDRIASFETISGWPREAVGSAVERLYALGVLDRTASLTPMGVRLAELPLDPPVARLLLAGEQHGCLAETLTIAAFLAISTNTLSPLEQVCSDPHALRRFSVEEGDLLTMLGIFASFSKSGHSPGWCQKHRLDCTVLLRVRHIRQILSRHASRFKLARSAKAGSSESIIRAILAAFAPHSASSDPNTASFHLIRHPSTSVHVHPSSVLFKRLPELVVFVDIVETSKPFMRMLTAVPAPEWISEAAPSVFALARKRHA